jgi:chromosome segregation ATPase
MKRFIESSPVEKREIFESIIDFSSIDHAAQEAEKMYVEHKNNLIELKNEEPTKRKRHSDEHRPPEYHEALPCLKGIIEKLIWIL